MAEVYSDDDFETTMADNVFSSPGSPNGVVDQASSYTNDSLSHESMQTRRKKVLAAVPKIPAVQRLQNSGRDTRSRSRSPTSSTGRNGLCPGTPASPLVSGNGSFYNGNHTMESEHSTSNGDTPTTPSFLRRNRFINSLVPMDENLRFNYISPTRRTLGGVTTTQFLFTIGVAVTIGLLYSLIDINISIGDFRLELHETMNNYQMHLINLQNINRLESNEGKEREKRMTLKIDKLQTHILELKKLIHPNYIEGISAEEPEASATRPAEKKQIGSGAMPAF